MTKKYVRTEPGERIDYRDLQDAIEVSPRDALNQTVAQVLQGTDSTSAGYVLSGFAIGTSPATTTDYVELAGSAPAGDEVRINRGVAILSFRDRGEVFGGCVLSGGPETKTLDISAYTNGAYGVYVRFEFRDSDYQNRLFWNANAATPVEYPRSIPTRRSEDWGIAIEQEIPGDEWIRIGTVTKSGGAVTAMTDERDFYFEGRVDLSYDPTNEWDAGDDRNDDRAQHGLFGLRRLIRAVQTQLAGITGDKWWDAIATAVTSPFLLRDGSNTITGDVLPDLDVTHVLGDEASERFLTFASQWAMADTAWLGRLNASIASEADDTRLQFYCGASPIIRTLLYNAVVEGVADGTTQMNVYRATAGSTIGSVTSGYTIEWVFNALWSGGTQWLQTTNTSPSAKIELSVDGFRMFYKAAGATTWGDILGGGTTGWDSTPFYVDAVSGWVEASGKLTAPDMSTGTFLATAAATMSSVAASGDITTSAGDITAAAGDITATLGDLIAPRVLPGASPATPAANALYADNMVKAWGFFKHTATGGAGSTGFDVAETNTWNIDLATSNIDATDTHIYLLAPMVGTYAVNITIAGSYPNTPGASPGFWAPVVSAQYATYFTVRWYYLLDQLANNPTLLDPRDAGLRYSISICGRQ